LRRRAEDVCGFDEESMHEWAKRCLMRPDEPYFQANLGNIRLTWPHQREPALRSAQTGALLALASHFATSSNPAQAVLPTGVGKTAVLVALPYMVPVSRVLVVVPTRLLREQIASEFGDLRRLRALGVSDADLPAPTVARVDRRLSSLEAWRSLEAFDVVVGTPGVLSAAYEQVADPPDGLFDLVIFDEAHHLPASTWTGILKQHPTRAALLTATPFRRDRKALPGTLVYEYSLGRAIADGVYAPVDFLPVSATGPHSDRTIAEAAIERRRQMPHATEGSLILVRTDRVAHARELVELYRELGAELGIITGDHGVRHVRGVIKALKEGDLAGVASVGALVEGFDLPAIKIAAYHRPHRTLPATLQFIGRIARVTGGTAPAELLAVPSDVAAETSELYREDVAWAELLPRLVDAAVHRERATREYLSQLQSDGPEDISPAALRPQRMVQAYRTSPGMTIDLGASIKSLSRASVVFRATSDDHTLLALITERRIRPDWIATDALDSLEYQLFLAVQDRERALLFVAAPSDVAARELCEAVGAGGVVLISPQLINRWLWDQDLVAYSSVGMRSARAPGARQASYRMLAGSTVEGALLPSESRAYAVGHLIGRRREGTQFVGIGVSIQRSKIWETTAAESLLAFQEWCAGLANALGGGATASAMAPRLHLALPGTLERFPEHPLAVVLEHLLVQSTTAVHVHGRGWVDAVLLECEVERISDDTVRTRWVYDDAVVAVADLRTTGGVRTTGPDPVARFRGRQLRFSELLAEHPSYVYFADGSSTHASTLLVPPAQLPILPADLYNEWSFADTDIRRESRPPRAGFALNVQQFAIDWCRSNLTSVITIVDDAAYEIADVVAIEQTAEAFRVHLLHCKFSSQDVPGARLEDLYEVVGQAVRSCRWTDSSACWAELSRRIRNRAATRVEGADRDGTQMRTRSRAASSLVTSAEAEALERAGRFSFGGWRKLS
jgi:superfamily II DNA or RNA helicase